MVFQITLIFWVSHQIYFFNNPLNHANFFTWWHLKLFDWLCLSLGLPFNMVKQIPNLVFRYVVWIVEKVNIRTFWISHFTWFMLETAWKVIHLINTWKLLHITKPLNNKLINYAPFNIRSYSNRKLWLLALKFFPLKVES